MKTTLEIDEGVMRELKKKAAHEGRTMSDLVETALRRLLRDEAKAPALPPLPTWDGGGFLVDPADREALYEIFDAEDPLIQEMKTSTRGERGDRDGR
jgi:hypothetical protein